MEVKQGYDYDSVLIRPKLSNIESRDHVNFRRTIYTVNNVFTHTNVVPIISAPMKGISGVDLVSKLAELGGIGIYHRFDDLETRKTNIHALSLDANKSNIGIAIGISGEKELELANYIYDQNFDIICVDIANGYLRKIGDTLDYLRNKGFNNIIAGNVVTREGVDFLYEYGANLIRVGIGGGSVCSTRNVTGIGYPQLSAIEDCDKTKYREFVNLVSDGGVKNSGNAVKSFAVGADFVMLGRYLAQSEEAENNGRIVGMASRSIQNGSVKSVEGLELNIEGEKRPLEELFNEFVYGVKSACTYLNCSDYIDIRHNAEFISAEGAIKQL